MAKNLVYAHSYKDFVTVLAGSVHAWLGATDQAVEGEWRWIDGPEAGQLFWQGNASGSAIGYANWADTQPDNATGESEDWGQLYFGGRWNDWTDATFAGGYMVEYDFYTPCTTCNPPSGGVPEPGTLALFALGLAGIAYSRRKQ